MMQLQQAERHVFAAAFDDVFVGEFKCGHGR
jgi:hypothetical protein